MASALIVSAAVPASALTRTVCLSACERAYSMHVLGRTSMFNRASNSRDWELRKAVAQVAQCVRAMLAMRERFRAVGDCATPASQDVANTDELSGNARRARTPSHAGAISDRDRSASRSSRDETGFKASRPRPFNHSSPECAEPTTSDAPATPAECPLGGDVGQRATATRGASTPGSRVSVSV